jgi:hypothetical protein
MGSVTALIIAASCTGFSGNGHEACSKAMEAGGKQSGIIQNIDTAEKKVSKDAEQEVHYLLGDTTFDVVGGGVFLAKTVREKSVQFNAPTFGLCDKITSQIGVDKYSLNLEWRFK